MMLSRVLSALLFGCLMVRAQVSIEPRMDKTHSSEASEPAFTVESATVVIPVHASTPTGSSVVDLKREDFAVFDNGLEQTIRYFALDDAPVSVGIVFDASASMRRKMPKAREAVMRFMQMANRDDEFFLVVFHDRPKLALGFTDDVDDIDRQVASQRTFGCTSLYDAVDLALRQMKNARYARKALVVFSDGGDNRSRNSFKSIKNKLLESDSQLYAIGIYPSENEPQAQSQEEIEGPSLLEELAEATGGRHFAVDQIGELPAISERVSLELRSQYILGFCPNRFSKDGRFHRINVKLATSDKLFLQYRRGYYAPRE